MLSSSDMMRTVIEAIQFGMIVVGPDRRIVAVNRAALGMMGYASEEEIVGSVCHGVICPAEEGRCPILDLGQRVDLSEKLLLGRGGRALPILKTVSRLEVGGGEMLLETFVDITRQKEAERRAEDARVFLQAVMDGIPEPVMVFGEDYRVSLMNSAARRFAFGPGDAADGEGLTCYEVSHHRGEPCSPHNGHPCPIERVKETGGLVTVVHEHVMPDGTKRLVEIMATPLGGDDGGPVTIIETSRDITERATLERHRAEFFEMVTHDLKSPLSVIIGYADLLAEDMAGRIGEDALEMVSVIRRSGAKLLGMVEDYLAVSRLESGSFSLNLVPEGVDELVEDTVREYMAAAHNKGLAVILDPSGGPLRALADRKLLQRALANLLVNAVNYTPEGGSITVRSCRVTEGGRVFAVISVADTGPGIARGERELIFEKYYRSPMVSGVKGSGLGLAIVKAVAEAHGGRVELASEEGRGSEFRLYLPVE